MKWLLLTGLILSTSAWAVRGPYYVAFAHDTSVQTNPEEGYTVQCVLWNPTAVAQNVTLVWMAGGNPGFNVSGTIAGGNRMNFARSTATQTQTQTFQVLPNEAYTIAFNRVIPSACAGVNAGVCDGWIPKGVTITVDEDSSFLTGSCSEAYWWNDWVGSSPSAFGIGTSRSIAINNGRPF